MKIKLTIVSLDRAKDKYFTIPISEINNKKNITQKEDKKIQL